MTSDEQAIMVETCILSCDKEKGVHRKQQGLDSGQKDALAEEVALKLSEGGGDCGEDHCQ